MKLFFLKEEDRSEAEISRFLWVIQGRDSISKS
jgi:hypothetical protein